MRRSLVPIAGLLILVPVTVSAQEIPIKSVPVATGSQFLLFPSETEAMGGLTLALRDTLADPFDNPARGSRVRGAQFSVTPHHYRIGDTSVGRAGSSARTLPLAALVSRGGWFGGAALVWQELSTTESARGPCCLDFLPGTATVVSLERGNLSNSNLYAMAMAGTTVPNTNLSVGMSFFSGSLQGLEGVRMLYAQNANVKQDGGFSIWRLGLVHTWTDGREAELLATHRRFSMEHVLSEWVWNEELRHNEAVLRYEYDETRSFGMRLQYEHPLRGGWRMGTRMAGDWQTHPKIPNYEVTRIPRDPGNSSAYNVGIGFARTIGRSTYGLDYVFEPTWSHTWANALESTPIQGTDLVIPAGGMTVENFFRFRNQAIRLGLRQRGHRIEFASGLGLRLYSYRLDQERFETRIKRTLDQRWSEWTLTAGLGYRADAFSVRYLARRTGGTGLPGLTAEPWVNPGFNCLECSGAEFASGNFIVAPASALDLDPVSVWTHRIAIIVPLGGPALAP